MKQESPFCPDIAATPDGQQVWLTLKDVGKAMVFNARPPFDVVKVLDTGPITNHVNFALNARGQFAYITIGGLNAVKVFKTDTFEQVAMIPTGAYRMACGRRATVRACMLALKTRMQPRPLIRSKIRSSR